MTLLTVTLAEPQHFSFVEKLLIVILVVASGAAFWRRFGTVLDKILKSKKDANFSLFPLGRRVLDFVWEVVCQAKVIRERPLAGLAHAFVFWGFCTFVLVTLNHFAAGLGVGFLDPAGWFGRFYFYFAAAFALACAAGILGLFIRRFLVRPRWLGVKLSWESGLIALLIFVLMVTYLASFFVADTDTATRALWWVHTLALLTFLPIIPHTKHLHLVLSPATVFLSRGGFSQIPPLVGDEDFGMVAGQDLTRLVSLQAYSCVECGRCTEHCPAANTGKLLNPKEIILGLRGYLNEYGPASDQPLLGKYNAQEAAFQCTTCGACEFQCPVGIEHLPILIGLRRGAVNTGAWEDDYGGKLFLNLERGSNPLGISTTERDKFIEKTSLPIFDGTQEYCLWLGCMGAYDPQGRQIVADFARILNYLGTSYGVLRKEKCTGDAARRLGNDLLFQQLAEANLETMAQAKVKKIVSICPHCVRTIQEDWKEYGAPPEIEHHSEFLARFAAKLPKVDALKGHDFSRAEMAATMIGTSAPDSESSVLKGHDFSRAEMAATMIGASAPDSESSVLKGHDFSRAENQPKEEWALAPEGGSSSLHPLPPNDDRNPERSAAQSKSFDLNLPPNDDRNPERSAAQSKDLLLDRSNPSNNPDENTQTPAPEKIVYHDPCYLGRYRNVYDEPRSIISRAGELVEAPRNHDRSFCCGAGGGLVFLGEETGERVSNVRAAELVATGATTIATACPFCNSMFRDALADKGQAAPQLLDIAQLTARGLPES